MGSFFCVNRILALKETTNSTKYLKKNENYNEILEKPLIFNLQTVSTARHRCRSSLSRPDIVGCGWEVAERVKKTTSVPKTKKKEELPMKLLDDPKIPTARRNPRTPQHSHKPLSCQMPPSPSPCHVICQSSSSPSCGVCLYAKCCKEKQSEIEMREENTGGMKYSFLFNFFKTKYLDNIKYFHF
jgi:hypothetical protein